MGKWMIVEMVHRDYFEILVRNKYAVYGIETAMMWCPSDIFSSVLKSTFVA